MVVKIQVSGFEKENVEKLTLNFAVILRIDNRLYTTKKEQNAKQRNYRSCLW